MMNHTLAFIFALLVTAGPALATTGWIAEPDPQTIAWTGTDGSGNTFHGHCGNFVADIEFDPADLASAALKVTIDAASCVTGDEKKDEYLPQEGWFNVSDYPKAVFAAKTFRHDSDNKYVAAGTLTLRGATLPVTLPFTLDITGDEAHVAGEVVLNRLDFGVGGGQLASPEAAAPEVTVTIDLHAKRA